MNPFESFGNKIKEGLQNVLQGAGFGPSAEIKNQERIRLALRELPGAVLDIYNFLETAADRQPLYNWQFRTDYLTKSRETVDQYQVKYEAANLTLVRRIKVVTDGRRNGGVSRSFRLFVYDEQSPGGRPLPMSEELIDHLMQTIDRRRAHFLKNALRVD